MASSPSTSDDDNDDTASRLGAITTTADDDRRVHTWSQAAISDNRPVASASATPTTPIRAVLVDDDAIAHARTRTMTTSISVSQSSDLSIGNSINNMPTLSQADESVGVHVVNAATTTATATAVPQACMCTVMQQHV
jgi:hypothetical protein